MTRRSGPFDACRSTGDRAGAGWPVGCWAGTRSGRATIGLAADEEKPPAASASLAFGCRSAGGQVAASANAANVAASGQAATARPTRPKRIAKEEAAEVQGRPAGDPAQLAIQGRRRPGSRGSGRLQGFPQVEAAKLAMATGMNDESGEVRAAAYETLLQFSTSEEICRYFLDQLLPAGAAAAT